ncbi:glycoside hydrolase family 105 protein [Streptomyces sp. NPDC059063]
MARHTPASIGGWSYPVGLYLYGQYLTYRRTHDERYLTYIKSYVDRFVDKDGSIGQKFNNLDSMQAGRLLTVLHHETGQDRYRIAAAKIRARLNTYPRTQDGGFWHADTASRAHQLWSDGVYMVTPFLVEYGKEFDDEAYTDREAVAQLNTYARHLQADNGLFQHAYDESRTAAWADKETGRAPEQWCRAIGWYSMAAVNVLDATPKAQPGRAELLRTVQKLAAGIARAQDPATGRWFQVADKGGKEGNWTETSCSSMFTFALSRAAEQGYVAPSYEAVARRGYRGVLQKISLGTDGRTNLTDISIGTNVGDYAFYVARPRQTNDFHGLGAFLIMNEQLRKAKPATAQAPADEWRLRWSPSARDVGTRAFETLEDDRAGSHPAAKPHIRADGDTFRFDMHTVDRDTMDDRQRQEVTGCRNGDAYLKWQKGQTWRLTYRMYVPSSLKATTSFTHIMQMKQPGTGSAPIVVQSLRRVGGRQTIELKIFGDDILVGRTDLEPLHDQWTDVDFQIKIGDGSSGSVRWILKSGATTVIDKSKTGVDTFLADRVRPKWGIYRSLGDTSGSLQNTYMLLTDMRAYQLV